MAITINGTTGIAGVDGSAGTPAIQGADINTGMFFPAADTIAFATAGTEDMRIDSSGNVGIGTTTLNGKLNVLTATDSKLIFNDGSTTGNVRLEAVNNAYSGYKPLETNGSVQIFATGATERMRIDSGGFTYINCTSSVASVSSYSNILFDGVAYFGMSIKTSLASAGSTFAAFVNSSGTTQGSIYANATNTVQYLTSSDYRLKENIAPMVGALEKVSALKPVTYNWKVDGSSSQGFIAHELAEVSPECVGGEKDAVDADGNPKYQGVDTSFLVATLTAAIQEQQALITQLQADVAALKGASA
jgi:hypothetical protein